MILVVVIVHNVLWYVKYEQFIFNFTLQSIRNLYLNVPQYSEYLVAKFVEMAVY